MTVVTVASRAPSEPYFCYDQFLASLARYNCTPVILGWNEEWKGLMTKPRKYHQWLKSHVLPDEPIIFCDAWDVVFAADPNEIAEEFLAQACNISENTGGTRMVAQYPKIVWNAEKNLFPDPTLNFPETGTSYRYLNSGFAVGYPIGFMEMFEWMKLDTIPDDHVKDGQNVGPNDQEYIQHAYLESGIPMALDSKCEICQTLHGVEDNELDFSEDRIRNIETGSYPLTIHLNGYKEKWKDKILAKLKL